MTRPPAGRWLDHLLAGNEAFRQRIDAQRLPIARAAGRFAVITCMDPRINPEALGLDSFAADGSGPSEVRVIRTVGGMADERSLVVAIHLAGIRELAFVMHSDCGNALAKTRIDAIIESLRATTPGPAYDRFRRAVGAPFRERLIDYLKAFDDPRAAVKDEIDRVRQKPFVPPDVILHGLVYDLATAKLEVVVDGYEGVPA